MNGVCNLKDSNTNSEGDGQVNTYYTEGKVLGIIKSTFELNELKEKLSENIVDGKLKICIGGNIYITVEVHDVEDVILEIAE